MTNLRIHATHAALFRQTSFSASIIYVSLLGICQDLVPGVHELAKKERRVHMDIRMCHLLEQLGVTAFIRVESQRPEER